MKSAVHIILAGGNGERMGILAKSVSKTLLPVGNTTLLARQIGQSIQAGIKKVMISTDEKYYNQIKIYQTLSSSVDVVMNPNHKYGPLPALSFILDKLRPNCTVVTTPGDIYFKENPFDKIMKPIGKKTVLLVAKACFPKELSRGGIVFVENNNVTKIVKKAISNNRDGFRWSGSAIFKAEYNKVLKEVIKDGLRELEDFFNVCLQHGVSTKYVKISDFINVNYPIDLHISNLYCLSELNKGDLGRKMIRLANEARKQSLQ